MQEPISSLPPKQHNSPTSSDPNLATLLEELKPVVSPLAIRYSRGDNPEIKDLQQEGCLAIVEAYMRFDEAKGSLNNFASRSAKGRIQNHRRRIRRWSREVPYDFSAVEGLSDEENQSRFDNVSLADEEAHEQILKQVDISFLHKAMDGQLTPQEKNVLKLLYSDDLPSIEVARVLRISAPRVTQIHKNAVGKIRRALDIIRN
jgi:RNA polymerase sigma factor (sigma-70 family)